MKKVKGSHYGEREDLLPGCTPLQTGSSEEFSSLTHYFFQFFGIYNSIVLREAAKIILRGGVYEIGGLRPLDAYPPHFFPQPSTLPPFFAAT